MDKERILSKIDELDNYLMELEEIIPENFEIYRKNIEKKRACERLLQILIECTIDICFILVKELKLGLPSDEEDIFKKLEDANIITSDMVKILRGMRGFRNILVHRYGKVDDMLVFENLNRLNDFKKFKKQILTFLRHQ
ncbi:MAG TPA: DUF86 domain-containing protein [Candidatus Altiarchaeales archaeon]|nr:DUF86 domain-containing protein [Candidatus Altiarchaeales archaeon]